MKTRATARAVFAKQAVATATGPETHEGKRGAAANGLCRQTQIGDEHLTQSWRCAVDDVVNAKSAESAHSLRKRPRSKFAQRRRTDHGCKVIANSKELFPESALACTLLLMVSKKSRQAKDRSKITDAKPAVEAGIELIEQLYELGCDPKGRASNSPLLANKTPGSIKEYVEKAKRFADNGRGYSDQELVELFKQSRQFSFPLALTHAFRLLSISDHRKRRSVQLRMMKERWTCGQLDAAIRETFGKRRSRGGRPITRPLAAADRRYAVVQESDRMVRVFRSSFRATVERQSGRVALAEKAEIEALVAQLCEHIQRLTDIVIEATATLPKALTKRMVRIRKGTFAG